MSARHYCDRCHGEVPRDDLHNLTVTKVAADQSWSDTSGSPRLEDRPAVVADICGDCRVIIAMDVGIRLPKART